MDVPQSRHNHDSLIISLHTHNAIVAPASPRRNSACARRGSSGRNFVRQWRTHWKFGHRDRGIESVYIITLALIRELDFSNLGSVIAVYERCTGMSVAAAPALRGRTCLHRIQRLSSGLRDLKKVWRSGKVKAVNIGMSLMVTIDPADIRAQNTAESSASIH